MHAAHPRDDRDDRADCTDEAAEKDSATASAFEVRACLSQLPSGPATSPCPSLEQLARAVAADDPPDGVTERRSDGRGDDQEDHRIAVARTSGSNAVSY